MPITHFINNEWLEGSGQSFRSVNPASGETVWYGKAASKEDVATAVKAAENAASSWALRSLAERISYLEAFRQNLEKEKQLLSVTISQETGKPLWDSKSEVQGMINKIHISIDAYHIRCPEVSHTVPPATLTTRHKPHGVIAVFGPYNFPGHLPNGHIVPALLAGNTIVFKPSELTPMVAEVTLELWEKSGLPKGVLNLIQGGRETGKMLAEHPGIQGLFFTGSYDTGQLFLNQFARHPEKILALELGGNNPLIIHDNEDIKAAAYLALQSAFLSSGQRCTCARRLIITETPQREAFLKTLISMASQIKVGTYNEQPEPYMGPLVSLGAAHKVLEMQNFLLQQGGIALLRCRKLKEGTPFLSPGLVDVTSVKNRPDQEIFGPLLQIVRVGTLEEAIQEANATAYGLAAGIITKELADYKKFFDHIHAGIVNWNTQLTGASSLAPFGGVGHSGNHRPSAFYAADYCSYPVASLETPSLTIPQQLPPGLILHD